MSIKEQDDLRSLFYIIGMIGLVLSVTALVLAIIPFVGVLAFIPAVAGSICSAMAWYYYDQRNWPYRTYKVSTLLAALAFVVAIVQGVLLATW